VAWLATGRRRSKNEERIEMTTDKTTTAGIEQADERALFESHYKHLARTGKLAGVRDEHFIPLHSGGYPHRYIGAYWHGWQARAALTQQAAPEAPAICGACGKPWDGESCAQKDNGWPHPVCYPTQPAASEVSQARTDQTALVMSLIGPMLDAFDGIPGDVRSTLADEVPGLIKHIKCIYAAMLSERAPATQQAAPDERHNIAEVKRSSDMGLSIRFLSARACSAFERFLAEPAATQQVGAAAVDNAEQIQWRNIQKVVRELAAFCFGDGAQCGQISLGAAYTAVVTSLTAQDGLQVTLEPLRATPADDMARDNERLKGPAGYVEDYDLDRFQREGMPGDYLRLYARPMPIARATVPLYRAAPATQQAGAAVDSCIHCGEPRNRHVGTCAMMCRSGKIGQMFTPATTQQAGAADATVINYGTPAATTASASGEKPFAGAGAWFPVDVLGNPMREYEPGKWENCEWPSSRAPAPSPATTASASDETITVQEAWEAAGGNPGIKATKQELLDALRVMDEAVDECDGQKGDCK
jgi:hypothetical protein